MKKLLLTILAACMLATPALAQESAVTIQSTVKDIDPALWVMKDEDTTIYLFGTVHILKPGLSWFDEEVLAAFERSDELVTEFVSDDPAAMRTKSMALGFNRTGPGLSQKLNKKDRAAYLTAMKKMGIPFQAFERFDAWMASMGLMLMPLVKEGYDPNSGADKVLETAASGSMKKRSGLETLDEQLGYFDSMSPRDQIAFLNATVAELPKAGKLIGEMIAVWGAGKPDALAKMMNKSESMTPAMTKLLLTDRNARWAEKLDARMDQPGTVFVAVGAGHLAGKDSVQDMLRARGFEVTRIDY